MATSTLTAAMPALELTEGESIVLEAIDPTTGAAVTGVVVNNFVIYASDANQDDPSATPLDHVYVLPSPHVPIEPPNFGGPAG